MQLSELREQIDGIDKQLIELFIRRMEVSSGIAEAKLAMGKAVHDPVREAQKLSNVAACSGQYGAYTRRLFETLFALSKDYQNEVLSKDSAPEAKK